MHLEIVFQIFFIIGGLTQGTHLITNLIEYIAKTAHKMTKNILNKLEGIFEN